MAKRSKLSLSIANLDEMKLCGYYNDEIRPVLLEATRGNIKKSLTMRDVLSSLKDSPSVRELLLPAARVAQTDIFVRDRLTGFINDCATKALSSFEHRCPSDARPRRAIVATWAFLSGELDERSWAQVYKEGLAAWAGWFAPKGFYANAVWAALDNDSWRYARVRDPAWVIWAEWAALNILAYLGMNYHQREKPDEIDKENLAVHEWAVERLALWLETDAPEPLPLPQSLHSVEEKKRPAECIAEFVENYEMEWSTIAAFPSGLKEIGRLELERNAEIEIPNGVTRIGVIDICDHPVVKLPESLRTVGIIDAAYDADVELPEGVETVGRIRVHTDSWVILPNSIRRVGSISTEAEADSDGMMIDEKEEFLNGIDQQEKGILNYATDYDSFVCYKDRRFIRSRKNLTFD